jgi:hypothetical protein
MCPRHTNPEVMSSFLRLCTEKEKKVEDKNETKHKVTLYHLHHVQFRTHNQKHLLS